jgi:hypothetical protein
VVGKIIIGDGAITAEAVTVVGHKHGASRWSLQLSTQIDVPHFSQPLC